MSDNKLVTLGEVYNIMGTSPVDPSVISPSEYTISEKMTKGLFYNRIIAPSLQNFIDAGNSRYYYIRQAKLYFADIKAVKDISFISKMTSANIPLGEIENGLPAKLLYNGIGFELCPIQSIPNCDNYRDSLNFPKFTGTNASYDYNNIIVNSSWDNNNNAQTYQSLTTRMYIPLEKIDGICYFYIVTVPQSYKNFWWSKPDYQSSQSNTSYPTAGFLYSDYLEANKLEPHNKQVYINNCIAKYTKLISPQYSENYTDTSLDLLQGANGMYASITRWFNSNWNLNDIEASINLGSTYNAILSYNYITKETIEALSADEDGSVQKVSLYKVHEMIPVEYDVLDASGNPVIDNSTGEIIKETKIEERISEFYDYEN